MTLTADPLATLACPVLPLLSEPPTQLLLPGLHLSADRPPKIPGLFYQDDWLDAGQEAVLLARLQAEAWQQIYQRRTLLYRRPEPGTQTATYRRDQRFEVQPMPVWLQALGDGLAMDGHLPRLPRSCGVNEYLPGQGIAAHQDDGPADLVIAILSLGSACRLQLQAAGAEQQQNAQQQEISLRRRSLLVLRGQAHRRWLHGVAPRRHDLIDGVRQARARRISITFRASRGESG